MEEHIMKFQGSSAVTEEQTLKGKVNIIKPFPLLFAEHMESKGILRRGFEIYDDPTTVSTTDDHEDAESDES
ncbi:MAG: hypothetical protein M1320_01290 [Patescibacteria group bacterium]|nr:hypothetical protein [Patescibacteria group bacterium]